VGGAKPQKLLFRKRRRKTRQKDEVTTPLKKNNGGREMVSNVSHKPGVEMGGKKGGLRTLRGEKGGRPMVHLANKGEGLERMTSSSRGKRNPLKTRKKKKRRRSGGNALNELMGIG